ncbi:MAG: pyruvate formate-lyase 1-activating enzyme [Alkaliphilus sp.]|nr:MAG: pyruvate formate-lyase 1-activating enzyme [Alkaliphilus sp.]
MSVKGRVHSVETFGTLDGPGIRYVIFLQGCPLKCKYCHNRDTWSVCGGTEMSTDELIVDIEKYENFFASSGGGVTISGGEPFLQPEFLKDLLRKLKNAGIHTCIDTSGYVNMSTIEDIIDYVDLFLLDIKHIDNDKHIELTGVSNLKTLEFAKYLSARNIPVWIRHVVVPTITDSKIDIINLAEFIITLKNVERVDILPYHSTGKVKWEQLGFEYPFNHIRDAEKNDVLNVKRIMSETGVKINT